MKGPPLGDVGFRMIEGNPRLCGVFIKAQALKRLLSEGSATCPVLQ